jgi:Ca2+-transporting ATPase
MTDSVAAPPQGLTSDEARKRLDRVGPNTLPEPTREALWRRLGRQLKSPLIYILLFALAVDIGVWVSESAHGLPLEAIAIAVILLLNAGLGAWQELKAEGTLAKLALLAAPQVWTMRDGKLVHLASPDLVPGDVMRLEAGDRVPADATIVLAENLSLDESVLTGESLPVDKTAGEESLAGTLLSRGIGWLEVTRTGAESAMGRLATMLGTLKPEPTPLERRLDVFGRQIARWVLMLAAAIAAAALLAEGTEHFGKIFLLAVALAVAAVPEGLPAVLTVTLALGVERMAKRKAVVRRLSAVEALGSVTVIATDKTGTLTENRMEVQGLESPDRERALRAMILANDADLGTEAGDPLDIALLRAANAEGADPARVRGSAKRVSSKPFDSTARFMRATVEEQGGPVSYLKGAPEVILAACDLPEAERTALAETIESRAAEGYRLLGLATGDGERETGLRWQGYVVLWDPPRPEVHDAVQRAQAAGIRVLMVTGDHPATALTVARKVGIEAAAVVSGAEMEKLSCETLRRKIKEVQVFARVTAEQKLRIVEALQADGEVVAMTGDGVNDAPALKRAQVGVAMGKRGSDVSREVADLVLLDDNFATIVAAVEEGRSIYENIQKFIRFLLSTNLSEVLVVTIGAVAAYLIGLREGDGSILVPLTAAQLLWINLATDGAPALALGLDRNPGVMERPPRDPKAPLLDGPSRRFVLLSASAKALVAFAILGLVPFLLAESLEVTRTAVFIFMAAGQLLFAYPARHTNVSPLPNRVLHLAVGITFAAQILTITMPFLMAALSTVELAAPVLVWVAVSVIASWGLAEAASRFAFRSR